MSVSGLILYNAFVHILGSCSNETITVFIESHNEMKYLI